MLVNSVNSFYNKPLKKDNPQFGALKIDRKVLSNVDTYKNIENLKIVKEIAEELKDTKFYDLYISFKPSVEGSSLGIIDKQTGQNISDSIHKRIYDTLIRNEVEGSLKQRNNNVIVKYGWNRNGYDWSAMAFEVATEEEAKKLVSCFNYAREAMVSAYKMDDIGKYQRIEMTTLLTLTEYLKIFEAVKAYFLKRREVPPEATEYVNKFLKDCIIE